MPILLEYKLRSEADTDCSHVMTNMMHLYGFTRSYDLGSCGEDGSPTSVSSDQESRLEERTLDRPGLQVPSTGSVSMSSVTQVQEGHHLLINV